MDKNLFGVSLQVTAPGVLAFGDVFRALRQGNGDPRNGPRNLFARAGVRDACRSVPAATPQHNEVRRRPMLATAGYEQTLGA